MMMKSRSLSPYCRLPDDLVYLEGIDYFRPKWAIDGPNIPIYASHDGFNSVRI